MIQPLRSAHRTVFPILGLVLTVVVVAGLAARPPEIPEARSRTTVSGLVPSAHGHFVYRRDGATLVIAANDPFDYPDALAYLSTSDAITDQSVLVGAFAPDRINQYALPPSGTNSISHLILYSPATQSVIDRADLGGTK